MSVDIFSEERRGPYVYFLFVVTLLSFHVAENGAEGKIVRSVTSAWSVSITSTHNATFYELSVGKDIVMLLYVQYFIFSLRGAVTLQE